jgi:DNA-binding SARP family transcriptional activator
VGVRFALLGTLMLAHDAGDPVAVSGGRQRALLASLLLSANVPVSADALAEAVWDGAPPAGVAATLRSHITRLRQALGPEVAARIRACEPGYLISVREPDLDVLGFETGCREAAAARRAGRWADASVIAARALGLWRGTPLADVPSQILRDRYVPGLEQARLQVLEDRAEADLRLGYQDQLIPELQELTARHPIRERFHAQLMEALARAGRQAEALEAYRRARRGLVEELGIEPGPLLRLLHQQILNGDPALTAPAAGLPPPPAALTGTAGPPAAVPRQLPAAVPQFTGRLAELTRLSEILGQAGRQAPGAVVISAIGGTAGVGKTALAVHWAHRVARRFPGGQLYVNLGGFDPSSSPVTPGEAIRGFLSALGVPADCFPASLAAQAGLYRSLLAGRQMLILLDNARDEQQVRPLLPGSQGCLVLVTSRNQLAGLAAAENASLLSLDVLPPAEARQMLAVRLGGQRSATEPGAVTEITDLCARLPLALAVAAARAAAMPSGALMSWTQVIQPSASVPYSPGPISSSTPLPPGCSGCSACTPGLTSARWPPPAWPGWNPLRPGRLLTSSSVPICSPSSRRPVTAATTCSVPTPPSRPAVPRTSRPATRPLAGFWIITSIRPFRPSCCSDRIVTPSRSPRRWRESPPGR